jgi:hypothetical protein
MVWTYVVLVVLVLVLLLLLHLLVVLLLLLPWCVLRAVAVLRTDAGNPEVSPGAACAAGSRRSP